MARTSRPGTAGLVILTALTAAACGGSPTTPTPVSLVLTCPANVQTVAENGQAANVTFSNPTVQGGTGGVSVSCSAPSGSAFPVGTTTVTCTGRDTRNATAQCTFSVTVTARPPAPRLVLTRFLAFGDSLTEGTVANPYVPLLLGPAESYPTRLQLLLADRYWAQSITVINAGLGGEPAVDGVVRLPGVLSQQKPEVLLLLEGANDLNALRDEGIPAGITQVAIALEEMVKEAHRRGIRVLLATLPPWRPGGTRVSDASRVPLLNDQIRQIATAKDAVLVDLYAAVLPDMDTLIGSDGLHPTEAGYQRMAETFFDVIVRTLEVRAGQ